MRLDEFLMFYSNVTQQISEGTADAPRNFPIIEFSEAARAVNGVMI